MSEIPNHFESNEGDPEINAQLDALENRILKQNQDQLGQIEDWDHMLYAAERIWGTPSVVVEQGLFRILDSGNDHFSEPVEILKYIDSVVPWPQNDFQFLRSCDLIARYAEIADEDGVPLEAYHEHLVKQLHIAYTRMPDHPPDERSPLEQQFNSLVTEVSKISLSDEPNMLSEEDIEIAKATLQRGDVLLVGTLRELSAEFIDGALTHALIYAGDGYFIHAVAGGVSVIHEDEVFDHYDTMMITRPAGNDEEAIDVALDYAFSKMGVRYDFNFEEGTDAFYCTELVSSAFTAAGIEMPEPDPSYGSAFSRALDVVAIHPVQLAMKEEDLVFQSHNLEMVDGEPTLIE